MVYLYSENTMYAKLFTGIRESYPPKIKTEDFPFG